MIPSFPQRIVTKSRNFIPNGKVKFASTIVPVLLLMLSCASPQVITFTGKRAQFEDYFTYQIKHNQLPPDSSEFRSAAELFRQKVQGVIQAHMNGRGYSISQVPDLTIEYKLILENKVDYHLNDSYRYGYPTYNYNYNPNNPYTYYDKKEYTEGTLIVDLKESFGKKLVWEASLDLKFNKHQRGKINDPVERAFNSIFEEYPYRAGSAEKRAVDHSFQ